VSTGGKVPPVIPTIGPVELHRADGVVEGRVTVEAAMVGVGDEVELGAVEHLTDDPWCGVAVRAQGGAAVLPVIGLDPPVPASRDQSMPQPGSTEAIRAAARRYAFSATFGMPLAARPVMIAGVAGTGLATDIGWAGSTFAPVGAPLDRSARLCTFRSKGAASTSS
jgi:hypothetical protein